MIQMEDFLIEFINTRLRDMLYGDLTPELEVDGRGEHSQTGCVSVLRS